ncbi:response regulator [Jiulongibacter sediminis]|uniref:histidine kinase n=1 Tax=Jiulongibacter sediminis TaxID=1605367 RepID=A0A0N8H9H9_9BACT|nr:response regulator [Jiulongibacter sediminis]KPM47420.1 hypothetical protein AFM12_14805 [Jiulongibacter sediminis]TBX23000.1 hypothetical protein TK44_14815 [Jiulongibacter sediminis]
MQSPAENTFLERNSYFIRLAVRLLVSACLLFSLTNFLAGSPLTVVWFNLGFGLLFIPAFWLLKRNQISAVWYLTIFYQAFIFGHAYFLLPGKQIETGLGLVAVLAPLFFSGRKLIFIVLVNATLYHLALFGAGYDKFFVGSYIFFFVLMLIMRAIVNENRRYEAQLEEQKKIIEKDAATILEASELKSTFFANITHELKTPLTLILAPLDSLLNSPTLSDKSRFLIQLIRKNGIQLLNRVNELLLFTQLEVKKVQLNESKVKVKAFFQEVFSLFELNAIQKGLRFEIESDLNDADYLLLDTPKLEIIVVNLLSNAIKFTPQGGRVTLQVNESGNRLMVRVADTGPGISPEYQETIFERFGRVSHETYFEGSGIGLALSKELVQLMDGELTLDDTYDEGAGFIVSLPWKPVEPGSASSGYQLNYETGEVKTPLQTQHSDDQRPILLLAEDNQDLRVFVADLLSGDYQVIQAADGKEALELLGKTWPDLIITDLMMPEMDGEELVRVLKRNEQYRSIPVIVLTAKSEDGDRINLLRIGVDDYLTKPFRENELRVRARNLIKNYHLRISSDEEVKTNDKPDFLEKVEKLMVSQLSNPEYGMTDLAEDMAMSQKGLQVKLKSLTGLTPKQYRTALLMHKARQKVKSQSFQTVTELSLEMGYEDAHYFSKAYKKHFGITPKEELDRMGS